MIVLVFVTCVGIGLLIEKRSSRAEPVALNPVAVPTITSTPTPTMTPTTTATPTSSPAAVTTAPPVTVPSVKPPVKTTTASPPPPPAPKKETAPVGTATCPTSGYGGVQPHVAKIGHFLSGLFGITNIGGKRGNAIDKDGHPAGLALDFHVGRVLGDTFAAYVLAHKKDLSVKYVIWRQRYNDGSGWEAMEDRGSPTANHFDHVHVSFSAIPTGAEPKC